jgi:transposase
MSGYPQRVRDDFIRLGLNGNSIQDIKNDHYPRISLKTLKRWEIRTDKTGCLVPKKSPRRPQKYKAGMKDDW